MHPAFSVSMLQRGYRVPQSILQKMPSSYDSREAIMAITNIDFGLTPEALLSHYWKAPSPFPRGWQRAHVVSLCELLSMSWPCIGKAKIWSPLHFHSLDAVREPRMHTVHFQHIPAWQCRHRLTAIEMSEKHGYLYEIIIDENSLPQGLLEQRSVVLMCLQKGWPVLDKLGPRNRLLNDAESLFRLLSRTIRSFNFFPRTVYCLTMLMLFDLLWESPLHSFSMDLRVHRELIRSVCDVDGRSLRHAERQLQNNDGVLMIAVANTSGSIVDRFGSGTNEDFERVVSLAASVRSRLALHDSFVSVFLLGMSNSNSNGARANRCHLPRLDRGIETSIAFKKLISSFGGVPLRKELKSLRAASVNLRKLGF